MNRKPSTPTETALVTDDDPYPISFVVGPRLPEHGVVRISFLQQTRHSVSVNEVIACEFDHLPRSQILQKQKSQVQPT